PLDRAPRDRDAFAIERQPHLPGAVDAVVLRVHPRDLALEFLVALVPPRRTSAAGAGVVVGRRGDRAAVLGQHGADRLDSPAQPTVAAVSVLGEPHERW